jgi:hypothetical protein
LVSVAQDSLQQEDQQPCQLEGLSAAVEYFLDKIVTNAKKIKEKENAYKGEANDD